MPFHHRHFQNIPRHIHFGGIAFILGENLPGDHTDDPSGAVIGKILGSQPGQMEGVSGLFRKIGGHGGGREGDDPAVFIYQLSLFVDAYHMKILQILHDGKVRQIPGGNGAPVVQQKVPGGVKARHLHRHDGIGSHGHGLAADVVHVPFFQQVAGVLVVGAEHTPAGKLPGADKGHEGFQVFGGGALPNHNELPPAELFHGVVHIGTFVVRVDAGGNVNVQILSGQAGSVTVNLFVVGLGGHNFGNGAAVPGYDAGVVHHLRQTQHPGMVKEAVHIPIVQVCAAFIQRRGGDTGGNHKLHIYGQPLRGLQHIVDAVGAHHIGNLMGVGDDGGGAVRRHGSGKFCRTDQAGLQVNVGVNETGADNFPGHVHLLKARVFPEAYNEALRNGNVLRFQLSGKNIHIGGVFQHQIRFLPACGHINDPLLLHELPADFSGPGFLVCHDKHLRRIMESLNKSSAAGKLIFFASHAE